MKRRSAILLAGALLALLFVTANLLVSRLVGGRQLDANGVRALHVDGRKPENGCRFAAAGHDTALCFRKTAVRLGRTRRPCGSDDSLSLPAAFWPRRTRYGWKSGG